MITNLKRLTSGLSMIQEIPTVFFKEIENSVNFGDHLFPSWSHVVFAKTDLKKKFEAVYNKYKSIKTKANRDIIVSAFQHNNQIEHLCNNQNGTLVIELKHLPKGIQKEIINLFLYLYKTAIEYHLFEKHASDTVKDSIDRFIFCNKLAVCPFCGIEGFLNLEGQSRIALDHWLCKDLFPMASVNFDNLFPIGSKCNERPAKGTKNVLFDNNYNPPKRIQTYYPYLMHNGFSTTFKFTNEPTIDGINDSDWTLKLTPINSIEQGIFESWNSIFNIKIRYIDFFKKIIFPMWEADYLRFIEESSSLHHAANTTDLKKNFKDWKAAFPVLGRPGSILYHAFIDYLINNASDDYLQSLCDNFQRQKCV